MWSMMDLTPQQRESGSDRSTVDAEDGIRKGRADSQVHFRFRNST